VNPKPLRNIPASIRQRLLNRAKADNRPFNEVLQYFAMERFLYRLSKSTHADSFILKGALMLRVWQSPEARPTMDIDMLGRTSDLEADIAAQVREILFVEVEPDGLTFDASTVRTERISEDADYEGIRVKFTGELDSARVNMRIDIGFGDVIVPDPEVSELPTVLDLPAPRLFCYSRESAIAEKFEAMLKLGELNSRMKDFYDIWLLSRHFDFDGDVLAEAIRQTLGKRGTGVPSDIVSFSDGFAEMKQVQWAAFRRRLGREQTPAVFVEVVVTARDFLLPIVTLLHSGRPTGMRWTAPGPWA
jgi:hypothetical protein